MSRSSALHSTPIGLSVVEASPTASVTPGASNVAGAWVELIAATTTEAQFVVLTWVATKYANAQTNSVLADLAVGAGGVEVPVASGILVGSRVYAESVTLPLRIPKGSRLSVRMTSDYSTPTASTVGVVLYNRDDRRIVSPTALVTMGAVTATSKGTTIGSNDTYVEISAATAQPYQALVCTVGNYDTITTATTGRTTTYAVGASGAERAIVVVNGGCSSNEDTYNGHAVVATGPFPAGTRIAAKCSDGATNGVSVTVLGVPYTQSRY